MTKKIRVKKFSIPIFLEGVITQSVYERWLQRKAAAHVRRDRKYGNSTASISSYKMAIHAAAHLSAGEDAYTGEKLDWSLISKWSNEESKKGKRLYKAKFSLLPTVDHVGERTGSPNFLICSWRTNDAKGDLSLAEFINLCQKVLAHNGRR